MVVGSNNAEDLRDLPDEKLEELISRVNGGVSFCQTCGEKTGFFGTPGKSSVSECHECGRKEKL